MSNVKEYSLDKKKETMANIQRQFDTAKAYSDDKVKLSIQTYELVCIFGFGNKTLELLIYIILLTFQVDKQIRKLDTELLRFKEKIKLQTDMRDAAIKAKINLPPKKGFWMT